MKNLSMLILSFLAYTLSAQLINITPANLPPDAGIGFDLVMNGDEMLVNTPRTSELFDRSGSVHYYLYDGTEWQLNQTIIPRLEDVQGCDRFGDFIAMSDEWFIASVGCLDNTWKVIFYRKVNGQWNRHSSVNMEQPFSFFGWNMTMEGNSAVIGAVGFQNEQGIGTGASFVYEYNEMEDEWQEQIKLQPEDLGSELFGESVYMNGDLIAIGSRDNRGNGSFSGAVYIFEKIQGTWQQTAKLAPTQARIEDKLGYRVDGDGDRLIISGFGAQLETGAAYIYKKEAEWELETQLEPIGIAQGDWFGSSVAIEGDVALVTARHHEGGAPNSGSLFVFQHINNEWVQTDKIFPKDGQDGDRFGTGLAFDDGKIVLGASGVNNFTGAIYTLKLEGVTAVPKRNIEPITLYPNPMRDFIHLDDVKQIISAVNIYSLDGKILLTEKYLGAPIDVRNLPSGQYVLKAEATENTELIAKFIKL